MPRRGKPVNQEAVTWVVQHPESDAWSDEQLAIRLKKEGFYSPKTYRKDIRVARVRLEAARTWRGKPMAKNQAKPTYNLYLRDNHPQATPPGRHHLVEVFERYHQLVARAKQLCVELNWPKTRWMEIFDWNKT